MFSDSGTGDQAEAVFYTVPALPDPGRYLLRLDLACAGHDAPVKIGVKKNGQNYLNGAPTSAAVSAGSTEAGTAHSQELLLSEDDELSFDVSSTGTQSYTWQVDFRLCRLPEDLLE